MKKVVVFAVLFFAGGLFANLIAQENIKAVMKKCERSNSVEMTYIINKDPETKKFQSSITTIKIKDDPNLIREFVAAFEKDKDNAYSVSGSIKNGVSTPASYKFSNGKDNYISCTISITDDNTGASVFYRESPNKPGNMSIFLEAESLLLNLSDEPLNFNPDIFRGVFNDSAFVSGKETREKSIIRIKGTSVNKEQNKDMPEFIEFDFDHSGSNQTSIEVKQER